MICLGNPECWVWHLMTDINDYEIYKRTIISPKYVIDLMLDSKAVLHASSKQVYLLERLFLRAPGV